MSSGRTEQQAVARAVQQPALPGLRVLHVGKFYPPYRGGMETHLQALCENLQPVLGQVDVVVANDSRARAEDVLRGVSVTRTATLFNLAAAPICPELLSVLRRSPAGLLHIHLPNPMAVLAYLASGYQGKLVVSYHSDIVRQKFLGKAFEPFLRFFLARAAAVIVAAPNNITSSPILSACRARCQVIPYGIPVEQFQQPDPAAVARLRQQYGERLIISVGRQVYYKGFAYLIRALAQVQGRLLLVGDGPLRASLESEARACGVADRVVFLGALKDEELLQFYHAADVFVLPSVARSEAFGIVQLEAMACGKPVVNTQLDSGVPFVSLDKVTGLTVPPADPAALAQAINRLLDDHELRRAYGQSALRRVREEFSLEVMTSRVLQLYAEVMSSH